jgi:hypothetical protein
MDAAGLSKSVRRIILLEQNASGAVTPVTLYQKAKGRKKKRSRLFRPLETGVRRMADAAAAYADTYADRHRSSNRKRRDGWIRDLNLNVARAARKGTKRLKLGRILMP